MSLAARRLGGHRDKVRRSSFVTSPLRPRKPRHLKARQRLSVAALVLALLAGSGAWVAAQRDSAWAGTVSLLPDNAVPTNVTQDHHRPVELGLRFHVKRRSAAVGAQFYKAPSDTGKHTATLWSAGGRRLARVTFRHETRSGLQQARFSKPVVLRPKRTYVISYTARSGRHSVTEHYFTHRVTRGLLVARRNAGVLGYHPGKMPRRTHAAANYGVDIMVRPKRRRAGSPTTSKQSSPPPGAFPTRTSVGLPAGWRPARSVTGTYRITQPGAVVSDLQVTDGVIIVDAPNVTLRRVRAVGTVVINDYNNTCKNGLTIESSEFVPNGPTSDKDLEVIGQGGYTIRDSVIDGVPEGLRVGARGIGCGPVTVENTFIRVVSPDSCQDWHGDGIQGYGGAKVTVRRVTIIMQVENDCYGTAPFFYPKDQDNVAVDIDGLLVSGGGYPFRNGMPGPVRNLYVVDRSWVFGPVDVNCPVLTAWQAHVARLDAAGQPIPVRSIGCTGNGI